MTVTEQVRLDIPLRYIFKPSYSRHALYAGVGGNCKKRLMNPLQELVNGLGLLEPFLTTHGFTLDNYENGKGSGGQFTIATYKNGDKKFVIGYRFSIGELYYQCDDLAVGHDFYLRQLGFADKMKFPDFQSDDKLDSFRHILADFELIKVDFFEGDCKELKRIAKVQKETIDLENKKRQTDYTDHFDLDIIRRARQEFKDKKFKESIRTYGTVKKKELLTDLDRKTLKIANERVR